MARIAGAFVAMVFGIWITVAMLQEPDRITDPNVVSNRRAAWLDAVMEYTDEGYIDPPAAVGGVMTNALDRFVDAPMSKKIEIAERLSRYQDRDLAVDFRDPMTGITYAFYSPGSGLKLNVPEGAPEPSRLTKFEER